jgi:methionine synthase reductase
MCPKIRYNFKEDFQKIEIKPKNNTTITLTEQLHDQSFIFNSNYFPNYTKTQINSIRKLPTQWKEVFNIKLSEKQDYSPCDAVGLLVPNSDKSVDKLIKILNFEEFSNLIYKIERTGFQSFTFQGTLHDFIKYRMDIISIPRKTALFDLTKNCLKKNELEFVISRDGSESYLNLIKNRNNLTEIIEEFGCRPNLIDFIQSCEIIKPRYYSMIQKSNDQIEILMGVINNVVENEIVFGHVSAFIKRESNKLCNDREFGVVRTKDIGNDHEICRKTSSDIITDASHNIQSNFAFDCNIPVEICIRQNKLINSLTSQNLICFCTGTGLAPFIAFYRNLEKNCLKKLKLIYGFRHSEDNLKQYFAMENECILAQSSKNERIYQFLDEIDENSNVFICGNMKMQKDVFYAIKQKYPKMVEEKRIFFDNWL